MEPSDRIETVHLYGPLCEQLIRLLDSLHPSDWAKPTVCRRWEVRDIAAHLLDVTVRRLSFSRDELDLLAPDQPIASYGDLVAFLNGLNADWVRAARRISPRLLVDLLRWILPQFAAYVATLDMQAPARFSVAWAGEEISPNWFDVAREYTEHWHHQQQIRDAVGAPPLDNTYWLSPVLATFMRALPYSYRDIHADTATEIAFDISGEAGGSWTLARTHGSWQLREEPSQHPATRLSLDQDTAWRHLTKGLAPEESRRRIQVAGDEILAEPFFRSLAVMA